MTAEKLRRSLKELVEEGTKAAASSRIYQKKGAVRNGNKKSKLPDPD